MFDDLKEQRSPNNKELAPGFVSGHEFTRAADNTKRTGL
jgi:hypothetical protein